MGSESLDEVGTILRSILTSEKNGIPLRKLEGEYRTLTGNRIPYRNLGFNTLEEYLGSIPDTVRLQRNYDGEMLVHVVVTESTAHVAQMVRGQKSAKPRTATRTAYRRPMSQNQSAYRPNRILSKYSSSAHRTPPAYTYKAAPPTAGDKRRPGYELYHPPAQRTAQPNFARQQPPSSAFGWPKKEQSPVVRNSDVTRSENKPPNSNFSAFASGGFQRSSFEKPPRFLKTSQLSSSSSSSISSLSNDEGGGARAQQQQQQQQQQQGAVAAPVATTKAAGVAASAAAPLRTPSEQTGWRQLDSSWSRSTPAVTTPPAGDTGWRDDQLATDGWGEPAQPIATSTAVKSLGWSDPSQVQAARPLATPAKAVTPTERRPVTIEPGQPRFDPFRSPTLAGPKPAWIEPAQERFDPFRSPVPIGQLKLDLSTPAEPKLAGIEPGQQRFDPFKSTALPNATTFGTSAAPTMGADAPRTVEPRFDPFRQPLRLDAIIPSQPPKPVAKAELGINLALSSTPAAGLGVAPQPPGAASLQTPTAAPALRVATEFAPQLATTFAPLRRPVSFDTPTTQLVEEPIPPTPNCQLVREYAQREGLAHSYTTMLHTHKRPHGAPPMWLAVLRLGDVKIPSFPNEMPTPDEAKEAAAACAVAKLRIEGKLSAHRVTPASNPEEVALLVTRIAQVVLSKPNGLVKEGVSAAYEERFYEQLPPYWLEHVAKSGLVHIDSGTQCILYPLEPKNVVQRERAPSLDKDDRNSSASNSSGEPSQSATDYVDIFVTCVTSTDSVFFRFVDYDDQYHELLETMALHYGTGDEARVVGDLMEGHLYATLYDDAWSRVQLVARQGNGKAECYFVDEGTVVVLDEAALVHLEDEFAVLPMQAIQCQLDGLAQHAQCDGIGDLLSEVLLGKSLVAEVTRREEPIMVVVYDTWGSEDVDLNSEIFRRLTRVGLPEKGCVGKTLLGHVRADGVVWLQPNAPGMREMHDFEEALNNYCQTNPAMEEEPVMDTLYACQCRQDGRFYRAVLTSPNPLPSGEFEVLFVDFGGESRAFLAEFRNIDCLGNPVVSLPRQAVKCRLRGVTGADGITWSETATAKLLSLAGKGTELLVRVAEPASYMEPALVELFKRHEQSRDLVSVNDTLAESLRSAPSPAALLGQR